MPYPILIVDDDAMMCRLLEQILGAAGYATETCYTAREAAQKLREGKFALVLLDVGLPDANGLDILAGFATMTEAKFIIVTGDTTPENVLRAIRDAAADYVRKPFEPQTLLDAVQGALGEKSEQEFIVLSAKPQWVELMVPCTRRAANRIGSFMAQLKADLPEDVQHDVGDAFRELLMNAIEWGGGLDPQRRVRISYLRTPRMLQYRIADPGPGFKFDGLAHAAISNPADDPIEHERIRQKKGLRPGGLGLMMVRALADELVYNEAQNEVVFIKYLHAESASGGQ